MNPLAFFVNALLTVPFLAACAWAQWLDETEQLLEGFERHSLPQTNLTCRTCGGGGEYIERWDSDWIPCPTCDGSGRA